MAIPGVLDLELYDYSPTFVPTAEAAVDVSGGQIILKDEPATTLPGGGAIHISQLIDLAYGEAEDAALAAQISNALLGASPGFIEVLISDESIDTSELADSRAIAELARLSQIPYTLSFKTYVGGFNPGGAIRFIHESHGIDVLLIINTVTLEIKPTAPPFEQILYTVQCGTFPPEDVGTLFGNTFGRVVRPTLKAKIRLES